MAEAVGYLGLGLMGAPMTRNLLKAGYPVVVWNRTRAKAQALAAEGAQPAASPAAVARRARIVFACLTDAAAVEEVVTGAGGLMEAVTPGHLFVDMTTNSPPVSLRLAGRLVERGAEMLDAPVSGGDVGAIAGTLAIMVGGRREAFRRVLPLLEVLGRRIVWMGERVGAGGYAKLANQIMVAIHLAAMGEALVFGAKAGLDPATLVEALSGGAANSEILRLKAAKVLSGRLTPGARATVQLKDLDYIEESMAALGFSLPVTGLVRALFRQLVEQGHGDEDHSAIVRVFEALAGVEARARN